MHTYEAKVSWTRGASEKFTDNRYSRAHQWAFDSGITIRASSSPSVVPLPLSVTDAVDRRGARRVDVSCHTLFLFFAASAAVVELRRQRIWCPREECRRQDEHVAHHTAAGDLLRVRRRLSRSRRAPPRSS